MAVSEKETFIFTWLIENFSLCPQRNKQFIASPTFVVDFLEKIEWQLLVYPRGRTKKEKSIGCFLEIKEDFSSEVTTVGFTLGALSVTGKVFKDTIENCVFKKSICWGNPAFVTREDIFNTTNGLLPNDTLTLTCKMWRTDNKSPTTDNQLLDYKCHNSNLPKEMCAAISRDEILNFRRQFGSNRCEVLTRFQIGKKSVLWPIRRFGELRPSTKLAIPVVFAIKGAPLFFLTIYLSEENDGDQCGYIEIRREDIGRKKQYFIKCKILVFNNINSDRYAKEDEHFFDSTEENDVWKFPTFADILKYKNDKYASLTQDVLYLRCEFTFTSPEGVSHVETTESIPLSSKISFPKLVDSGSVGHLLDQLCKDGKFTDVILRTGDRNFKAHKNVLAAQSPVFCAMFENNMAEKDSGIVEITDLDPETVSSMLDFMYIGTVGDLSPDNGMKLYSAADKYEIVSLKQKCSCVLKSNLSVSNICSFLTLADLHHDDGLMDEVQNFIRVNPSEVFRSQSWEDFTQRNSKLAVETMLKFWRNA